MPRVVLDAPSNLGLRPPAPGVAPGVYKLAGALRDQGLLARLKTQDGGVITPPRYLPDWDGHRVRNAAAIAAYSQRLAERVGSIIASGGFPIVLGGDCSILLGNLLELRKRGHFGLVFLDGHLDFRHPGNSSSVGAAGGEDLALVTGLGTSLLTDLEGLRPYVQSADVIAIGARPTDQYTNEARATGITIVDAFEVRARGATAVGRAAAASLNRPDLAGYWIHLDADILDGSLMPAVDSPEPDGLTFAELTSVLRELLSSGKAVGMEITIFDPDLDPTGSLAGRLTNAIVAGFEGLADEIVA